MTSVLRKIVAGPRVLHAESGLDLCYVTDKLIATSGPSSRSTYRTPLEDLVKFLDERHGSRWFIWEFRAEGVGYNDHEVYSRIHHFPWPDHHPPPFALIPEIMASIRDWLKGQGGDSGRIAVFHCKAGKGRTGTVACSYLISEEGWAVRDALARFTSKRMRPGFGEGVSIPSQLRWIGYVAWWTEHGKVYLEQSIEILEIRVWGLRNGVKVAVDGFVDEGRKIKSFHTFSNEERTSLADQVHPKIPNTTPHNESISRYPQDNSATSENRSTSQQMTATRRDTQPAALFRPSKPIILPTSDININFKRHQRPLYGFTLITSVAHVWFNAFFESNSSSKDPDLAYLDRTHARPPEAGVFSIPWESMDGVRGFPIKGARAVDRLSVVWRVIPQPRVPQQGGPTTEHVNDLRI